MAAAVQASLRLVRRLFMANGAPAWTVFSSRSMHYRLMLLSYYRFTTGGQNSVCGNGTVTPPTNGGDKSWASKFIRSVRSCALPNHEFTVVLSSTTVKLIPDWNLCTPIAATKFSTSAIKFSRSTSKSWVLRFTRRNIASRPGSQKFTWFSAQENATFLIGGIVWIFRPQDKQCRRRCSSSILKLKYRYKNKTGFLMKPRFVLTHMFCNNYFIQFCQYCKNSWSVVIIYHSFRRQFTPKCNFFVFGFLIIKSFSRHNFHGRFVAQKISSVCCLRCLLPF